MAPTEARRGAASPTSQLVTGNDGEARPTETNYKRTNQQQQRTQKCTSAMRVLLAAACLTALLLAPASAQAKTHPSKRQAQQQLQPQPQPQPASGRDQTNWWNLWWQQYINEAQQPSVRPIVSVSFEGQTIDASNYLNDIERARPNEPASSQLRQAKSLGGRQQAPSAGNWAAVKPKMFQLRPTAEQAAARTNRQANDELPVVMMQQQQISSNDDDDDQMNQILLSSGRQAPPRPQVSSEFGIQMRPKPARQHQASSASQRARAQQELQRSRQLEQQRQQAPLDSEYLEQQQLQHQVSDYAEEAELEQSAFGQNGTAAQAAMDENEVQPPSGSVDSSSSSMMMPERPKAASREQETTTKPTSTTSAPTAAVSGRADTPPSTTSQPADTTTTKRPDVVGEQTTTTTTTAPGNRLPTAGPSSTPSTRQQQKSETSEAAPPGSSTTQTPLPVTTNAQKASETPISIGGDTQSGSQSSNMGGAMTAATQRQQRKQTTPSGQDRVELQNGRPATSGMMFVSGRPQLFATSASTSTTAPPTTTSSGTTRSNSAGSTSSAGAGVSGAASEQPASTPAGTSANATATTSSSEGESDSEDESEEEQPAANLNNSPASDSEADGEEEEGDEGGESDGGADQSNGANVTSTTTGQNGATQSVSMGSGSSSSGSSGAPSEPTTQQPMLTGSDIDIERLPKANEPRGQTSSQATSSPATQSTKKESGEQLSRATDGSASTTAAPFSSAGSNQRQQQVLMMTVDTSRGTLDGESAITVPMDAVMRMMMGQSQMSEQASTTSTQRPTVGRGEQINQQTSSTIKATTQTPTGEGSSTSGRLLQQSGEKQQTPASTSGGAQQQSSSTASTSWPSPTSTTRKKLQPPPTTRTPGSNVSLPASQQDSVATRQQTEGGQTGANAATTASGGGGAQSSSSSGSSGEFMGMTTSSMNLDDEAGGREPKIELLNMDLVPIQRIINSMSSSTTSLPVSNANQQQQQQTSSKTTKLESGDVQQEAMNVDVEPGMRLRPPSGQQPRVTMIEQVRPSTMRMEQQQQQQTTTSRRPPAPPTMLSGGASVMPNQMNQMNTVYMIMMPPEFAPGNTTSGPQSGELQMMIRNQEDQQQQQQQRARDKTSQMKQMLAMLQTAAAEQERVKTQQQTGGTSMRLASQTTPAVTSGGTTPARPLAQTTTPSRSTNLSQQPSGGQTSMTTSKQQEQQQPTMTTSGQQLMRIGSSPATTAGGAITQTPPPPPTTTRPRFVSKEEFLETVRVNQETGGASNRSPSPARMQTSGQQTTMAPATSTTAKPAGGFAQIGAERRTSSSSASSPSSPSASITTTGRPAAPITTTTTMAPTAAREREGQSSAREEPVDPIQPLMVVVQLQNGTRVATPVTRMPPSDTLAALRQGAGTSTSAVGQPTQSTQPAAGTPEATMTTTGGGGGQRPAPTRRPLGVKTGAQKAAAQNATGSFIPAKLRQDFGAKPTSQTINEIKAGGRKNAKLVEAAEPRQSNASSSQLQDSTPATTPPPMVQSMAIRQFGGANRMSALAQQPVAFGRPATMMMVPASQSGPAARLQQSSGPQYPAAPSFEYGPAIAVRRPDEPLANGQMPNCTLTGKNFCVLTKDYPMNEVRQAVERSFRSVRIMYEELQTVSDQELHKDDFKNATSSQAASGRFACQTQVEMMRPGWAKDEITREWMLVVNTDVFPQRVRTESCAQPNTPCEFIAPFYDSTCQQRYSLHRMIAIDPHDPTRSPQVAVFKFPAGCVCRVHPIRKGSASTQAPVSLVRQMTTTSPATFTTTTNVPSTTINVATSTSIRRRR